MSSRFPVATLFGALIHVVRHEPGATEAQAALLAALHDRLGGAPLRIGVTPDALLLDEERVPRNLPGATLLLDQLALHGIGTAELGAGVTGPELLGLAAILAAFAGTYETHAEIVAALGPGAARIRLSAATDLPREVVTANLRVARTPGGDAEHLSGGREAAAVLPLGSILERGRRAIAQEDWDALLDAALQLIEAEDQAPSEHTGQAYRFELKRLVSREHLGIIARLAHGERRQEAIGLLRRFGSTGTKTLVELLVAATDLGERRGYYTALTQMGEGTEVIIEQLEHPIWYVVRNAAELCGDMELRDSVSALARQIQHHDERVRKSVAGALGRIATAPALQGLQLMLDDPSPLVRRQALVHLIGLRAQELCPAISDLLQRESSPEVQREALFALGRIGSDAAITVLHGWAAAAPRHFGRKSLPLRVLAIKGLALAGPAATQVLSNLTRDDAPEVRMAANGALEAMQP